jgi:hypothetical protein
MIMMARIHVRGGGDPIVGQDHCLIATNRRAAAVDDVDMFESDLWCLHADELVARRCRHLRRDAGDERQRRHERRARAELRYSSRST